MKKLCATLLCLALCMGVLPVRAAGPEVNARAALLMEKSTGQVLYEANAHAPLELASVTKVMTMLLIMEAMDAGTITKETMVPVSATAAGMGGSQVYMEEGEEFSVHDMLKAIAVASGNDACVAMAEYLAGSESAFVEKMNARAAELGMEDTVFCNCTGLPAEGHHSSAYDIALMSRELILHHPDIRTYTTVWMDTLRDGDFQLANTNKLVRHYKGATGLKTGTTDAAGHCLCATATRDGMDLIAVVMGCKDSDTRFEQTKQLLDYGFSSFMIYQPQQEEVQAQLTPVPVVCGAQTEVLPQIGELPKAVVRRDQAEEIEVAVELVPELQAPVLQGDSIGTVSLSRQGETLSQEPLTASQTVERMTFAKSLKALLRGLAQVQG